MFLCSYARMLVCSYPRSAQFSGRKEVTLPEAPDVEHSPVDEAIVTVLAKFPFPFPFSFSSSSVRELSQRICLPRSTVHRHRHRHLKQSLRFIVRHLRWVSHILTAEQNRNRFGSRWQSNYCKSSRCIARTNDTTLSPRTSCEFICSVNISEHDLMWTVRGEIVVDREWHTVQSPKLMLTVVGIRSGSMF
jgi:hypothetical protein